MTSNIVTESINENYPVAGQNNNSQGFRTNFTSIKNALNIAKTEISDLQTNTAKKNETNDFNGSLLLNAQTNRLFGIEYSNGLVSGSVDIDYKNGEYQTFILSGNTTFTFKNLLTTNNVYSKLRISIRSSSTTNYTATFLTVGGSVISQSETATFNTGTNPNVSKIFESWTQNNTVGGKDVYISVLGNFDTTPAFSYELNDLSDINLTNVSEGNILRYIQGSWQNTSVESTIQYQDPNLIQYDLYVSDNVGTADEFYFGDPNNSGVPISESNNILLFNIGNIYRFNTNDSSNSRAPLRFSSTKPSETITEYTNNIIVSGVAGTQNSYVDLLITKDTPHVLYMYGDATGTASQPEAVGKDIPIYINTRAHYTGSSETNSGTTIDSIKSVSYFITTDASTSLLSEGYDGQIKTLIMDTYGGDMVVTVINHGWTGTGIITFSAEGQTCTLQYINNKWFILSNNGVTVA